MDANEQRTNWRNAGVKNKPVRGTCKFTKCDYQEAEDIKEFRNARKVDIRTYKLSTNSWPRIQLRAKWIAAEVINAVSDDCNKRKPRMRSKHRP